jgi:RimJ/RimL family protein N-acetyltransferase
VNSSVPTTGLPPVSLREVNESDQAFLAELDGPSVKGEWDTYDDAPHEMLNGKDFNGGARIVELPDGTPIGTVSWIQTPHGPNQLSRAWVIGIVLHPRYRGRGLGASAQSILAQFLFDTSRANRVEASTDVRNLAEQRSLTLAGFTNEGVRRGALWRRGEWHDQVIFSRLRSD